MHLTRLVPVAALLGTFFSTSLFGQESAARLLDARLEYEQGMTDLLRRVEDTVRNVDAKAAVRNEHLKALRDRGEFAKLEALAGFARDAEDRRCRLLEAFESCADRMVRSQDAACDQVLVEQALWLQIRDSLPWRPVAVASLAKHGETGLAWKPPAGASRGYRLQVWGSVDRGTEDVVELVLPVALPECGIVRVPVADGQFAATVTVGPDGKVALDLGVPRDAKAFGPRKAPVEELRIVAATPTLQVSELQWKPFLVRTDEVDVAVDEEPGDAAERKQKAGTPADAVPVPAPAKPVVPVPAPAAAVAPKGSMWEVGTKVEGWRTGKAKPQTQATDCSLGGQVSSVADDCIVFAVDERWRGPRGWVASHREWVWKRVGFDKKNGETLLELVEARKDGRVVTLNPRGSARLKGNTMRGSYRVDFTNGTVHANSAPAHDWILEVKLANGGK